MFIVHRSSLLCSPLYKVYISCSGNSNQIGLVGVVCKIMSMSVSMGVYVANTVVGPVLQMYPVMQNRRRVIVLSSGVTSKLFLAMWNPYPTWYAKYWAKRRDVQGMKTQ